MAKGRVKSAEEERDPAFLFYSKDWIEGTAELSPDVKGVFIDLLAYQHRRDTLPNNTEALARMARMSHEDFLKIWSVLQDKFEVIENRLVNRKLTKVMTERLEKGWKNTITGTFASILRLGNYSKEQYQILKKSFRYSDFLDVPKEELTKRLTEWSVLCLKSIVNVNADVNVDEDSNWKYKLKNESKEISHTLTVDVPRGTTELIEKISRFFSVTQDVMNPDYDSVSDFVETIFFRNEGGKLSIAFDNYVAYKARSEQQIHGIMTWIGTKENYYQDGAWNKTDWEKKNKAYNGTAYGKHQGPTTASSAKIESGKDFGDIRQYRANGGGHKAGQT